METGLPLLFLDLETTGHEPLRMVDGVFVPWHEIIEIGAVLADQRTLEEHSAWSCKVRPTHPERCIPDIVNHYPERASRGEWDGALLCTDALIRLLCFARSWLPDLVKVPCGQNPTFDWSFLNIGFALSGDSPEYLGRFFHYAKLDTRSMAVQALWEPGTPYDPDDYSLRRPALAERLGILPEPYPHEALNGARQSLEVFRMLRRIRGGTR